MKILNKYKNSELFKKNTIIIINVDIENVVPMTNLCRTGGFVFGARGVRKRTWAVED